MLSKILNHVFTIGPSAFPLWFPLIIFMGMVWLYASTRPVIDGEEYRFPTYLETARIVWHERDTWPWFLAIDFIVLFALDYIF